MRAIELLEESVNLLRNAPASTIILYLTGAIPFTLGLLFFLNDMMRSPFAFDHLAAASLGLAVLYVWKNVWQANFAAALYRSLAPDPRPRNLAKLIAIQAALQPVGLVFTLPLPWLVAFFRNVGLFAALNDPDPVKSARRQAMIGTKQNWGVIAMTSLAALILFVNILIMVAILPQLARSFLGIEGDFARLGSGIVNLATVSVAAALTWLVIDPLLDAVCVLRCFYGASKTTGEDLRSALRQAIATFVLLVAIVLPASAQVKPDELDQSIDQVIHSREFTWRSRKPAGPEPTGRWVGWVRSAEQMIHRAWEAIVRTIRGWLEPKPQDDARQQDSPVTRRLLTGLIGAAVALVVGAAVFFFLRRPVPAVSAQAVTVAKAAVNLADESVTADQLPESSWMQLAEEWMAKGDCRLALRALYLAGLNYLGQRQLVSIRRWKSGLDYRQELDRRTRATPAVSPVFARNVAIFERGWYGPHAVDREMVEAFAAGLTEMKAQTEGAKLHVPA